MTRHARPEYVRILCGFQIGLFSLKIQVCDYIYTTMLRVRVDDSGVVSKQRLLSRTAVVRVPVTIRAM